MRSYAYALMASSAIGTVCLNSPVNAQETSQETSIQLAPIVITSEKKSRIRPDDTVVATESATGTKTETPIVDTPAAVSVVTQKELETRNVESLQGAVSYTSGVAVDEFGSDDRYDYFRIRGFDQTTLGTYRDGLTGRIPAWYTASRLEPYGLQRVEVLKGSTSTLFGLNGPGGLVNAITLGDSLKPQEGKQYEIGLKYRPESFEGLFTVALFDLNQTNVPSWDSAYTVQRQIGEVNVRGVELEGKMALADRLNLTLAYSYWDAEITGDGDTGLVGNRPERVPEHVASAWLDYTFQEKGSGAT